MACQEFVCSFCCCHDWEWAQVFSGEKLEIGATVGISTGFDSKVCCFYPGRCSEEDWRQITCGSSSQWFHEVARQGSTTQDLDWCWRKDTRLQSMWFWKGQAFSCLPDKVFEVVGVTSCLWIEGSCTITSPVGPESDLLDDQQEVVDEDGLYSPTPPGSEGEGAVVAQDREKRRKVQEESSPDPYYTRRCPACESGMNVPGILHNAECKRKRASLQAQPSSVRPEVSASASAPAAPGVPAIADSPEEDFGWLDHPMFEGPSADEAPVPMEFGIVDLCQCGVLVKPSCLSDSELVSVVRLNVESIASDGIAKVNSTWLISVEAVWNSGSPRMWFPTPLLVSWIHKELSRRCRKNVMGWQLLKLASSWMRSRKMIFASVMVWSPLHVVGWRTRSPNLKKVFVPGLWFHSRVPFGLDPLCTSHLSWLSSPCPGCHSGIHGRDSTFPPWHSSWSFRPSWYLSSPSLSFCLSLSSPPPSPHVARLPWGSKVICAAQFAMGIQCDLLLSLHGSIVIDCLWFSSLTSITLDLCPPHKTLGLIAWAAAQLWWLLLIGVPHFSLFSRSCPCGLLHQLADRFAPPPSSGGLVSNAWLRLVFDTWRPFWADSEVALDFPLGLAALRLAVNLARFTKTRVCLSCFGSPNSGHAASHQDPDLFKLLRLYKSWAPCKCFNFRTAFHVMC